MEWKLFNKSRQAGLAVVCLLASMTVAAQTTTGVSNDGTATDGQSLWTSKGCSGCHGLTGARANAANAGAHISYANTQGMGGAALTTTERNNIAAYIAASMTTTLSTQTVTFEGTKNVVAPGFTLNTSYGDYVGLRTSTNGLSRGTVTYSGTTISYTASANQCGTDTFTYEAYRSGASVQGTGTSNERSVTFDIADPAAPNISTSASTKTGTYNTAISSYTPTSTGGKVSTYIASGLPSGLSVASSTGVISGTPTQTGTFNVTLTARNCLNGNLTGQTNAKAITFTISKANQAALVALIGGSSAPLATTYAVPNGTGTLSTSGGSGTGAVSYVSNTTSVCTVSASTVTYIAAGTCTVQATKATDTNYNAATDTVTITVNKATQAAITATIDASSAPPAQNYVFPNDTAPLAASGGSGTGAFSYATLTASVCTVASTTVTFIAAGTCTVQATKAADTNYNAMTDNVSKTINATVPGAPTVNTAVGGNAQAVINFTAPTNTGGVAILDYTATCTASGQTTRTATVAASPATVTSMVNGVTYACSVTARNSVGSGAASSPSNNVQPTSAPVFTSLSNTTFTVLSANTFTVTATGAPTPTLSMTGTLPSGVTFTPGTGALAGTPAAGTVGSYPLTFTANNGTSVMQSFTLTVAKSNQTITFNALADRPINPTMFVLSATSTSGLSVTFSSATPSTCTVVSNIVQMTNVGTCTINANQSGNTNYNAAAQVQRSFQVTQGTQTITFGTQSSQTYSPSGMFSLSPVASSSAGLAISYASLTTDICTIVGTTVSIVSAGDCQIEASQAGNANYAAAADVTQNITIKLADQTISWGAQTSQSFGTGGTFPISPVATGGGSGNPIIYSSTTTSVCTVAGTTVTKVRAGTCTLKADQAGDENYNAANSVTVNVTINPSLATAPVLTDAIATDSQVKLEFEPSTQDGGSTITSYKGHCGPAGNQVFGSTSPIVVTGLNNGFAYNCAVTAINAAGDSTSNIIVATPVLRTGTSMWTTVCSTCHGAQPAGVRFNAGGTTGSVIGYVRSVQTNMIDTAEVQELTLNELAEIAKYIDTFVPAVSASTAFQTPVNVDVSPHLTLGTVSFESAQVVTNPANGTLGAFSGTQIQYTPNAGFVGMDTFTYRGFRTGSPNLLGDPHTVTVTVAPPPAPVITSATAFNATFNTLATYQITATNSPTSYGASGLGANCSINTMTGLISCTPMTTGTFNITVTATNAGGTGMQTVMVTVSKANQSITFGAQANQTYALGGTFNINPVATASSGLAVTHSSLTTGVCTVSGTTVTMVMGGTCTLAADQAGNANYNAALQVTQNVTITPTAPGAPTGLIATPGPLSASIAFTPPASNGGSAITGYTANCTPTATGNAASSPINLTGLTNGQTYTCTVSAANAAGSTASTSVMVTPTAALSAPAFTSNNSVSFNVLASSTFTVAASGNPAPTLSVSGTLPSGVTFTPGTGALAGTPATGTANTYTLTFTATNSQGTVMQNFTLTVAKLAQTITFANPGTQSYTSPGTISLTASSTSGLSVTLASTTPSVCTVSGTQLTTVTTGVCSITASQAGNADYNAATDVTRAFSVIAANQTITFNTQSPSSRNFLAGSTFSINPVATASSGLAVLYSSTTTGVCTVAGTTVTMVAPGTCTLAANQGGNANYNAATQVTQNVSLNATVPGAPTIGTATGGNGQATIEFTAPSNNGGSAITGYIATCNPGGITGNATVSPVVITGLTNSTQYTCSVAAINAVGTGASSSTVMVTPLSGQGSTIWANVCTACHTTVPSGNQLNGAGTTATVLNFVRANQTLMAANSNVQALTNADLIDLATYIGTSITDLTPVTAQNTPVNLDVSNHITLTGQTWSAFTSVEVVTGPTNGSLGSFGGTGGTVITYTPNNGFTGTDSFTYRGKRGSTHNGDARTITIIVNPPAPSITSATSASGTFNAAFNYQITASNTPTSFNATGLPAGLSVNTGSGAISGTPTATGSFSVQLSATNAGGTGNANLTLTIDPASQTITFGAQTSPRTWSQGGTFPISPTGTGGASGNAIVYSSLTTGVCTVSGTTVTIVTAGTCTIAANQAGNANYAAATQVTQNVTINAVVPGAPTGVMAIAGDTVAAISFTAPASNGGAVITQYSTSCTPAATFNGAASPINLSGLTNGQQYTCTVSATNSAGAGPASGSVMFTPTLAQQAPSFTSANNTSVNVTEPLSFQAAASGTPASFTFSLASGTLPSGVTFSSSGLLSGTPASGTAGTYPVTLNVSNGVNPSANQSFTLTVNKIAQTITFANPGSQVFTASPIMVSPSSTSGLAVTVVSNTTSVCTVSGTTVTFVTVGQCNLTASQAGNGDYLAASNVSQEFTVSIASQTITFPAQSPSSRNFSAGASFAISPVATASSGLAVTYSSTTTGVCTVSGSNVTQVAVGTCTIAANQAGNANFSAAAQVTRSVTISPVAASAPQNLSAVARDGRGVFSFTAPSNNGGSAITSYTVTCGAITGNGSASPVTVNGLTNGMSVTCSVAANTAAGAGTSASFSAITPNVQSGSTYWSQICTQCHATTPTVPQTNAGGTTVTVLNYVIANQPLMSAESSVTSLTTAEKTAIVGYIASVTPTANVTTAFNTAKVIDLSDQISVGTVAFESLEVVTGPANGSLSAFTGTSITYTPTTGYAGADSFTFRGKRTTPSAFTGDTRTVNITVTAPPAPVITSATTTNATFGVMGTYQITATNSPVSYAASGLPGGCSINTPNGLITCTPTATGTFMVTVSATNPGGTGMQTVTVTVAKANQTITFGAQGGQMYALNGTFPISPVATASSGLTVTYSSLTTGVCTVSGTTVTMVMGGTCTLAADQAGDANYNAALQVTQNVTITATVPGQPTGVMASAGDSVASLSFTAPANTGGSPITSYSASCTPSGSGTAATSPISLTGLTNGQTYTCTVRAVNAIGNGAVSSSVMFTPAATLVAPTITSANATTFPVLTAGNFQVTATGTPSMFTYSLTGSLPSGVSFNTGSGLLSGTPATGTAAGSPYALMITVSNGQMPNDTQSFSLTVAKLAQTITFANPGTQSFTASAIPLTASTTSPLTVTLASTTPAVCTVSGTNLTLVTTGVCSITASQAGNADYNAATDVTRAFSVIAANQTITFNTQSPSSRNFLAGSTFSINPLATASSGLAVLYSSTTTGVCTVAGTTVTMVAPGTCTIAANQGGNANYNAATQVTQNVSLNATVPGAPTIGTATGGNGQATIEFTAPTNNGGSAITGYIATCNPGGITGNAIVSPVVITGLTNSTQFTCSVAAINGVGTGASSSTVMVTPLSGQGATIWANVCDTCHATVPSGNQFNGAGTTATVLQYVRANQTLMKNWAPVQALNAAELADVAAYIAAQLPVNAPATPRNTPVLIDLNHHITFTGQVWSAFDAVEVVTPPANGTLGSFSGTQIQYTPNMGFTGTDTFSYRGKLGSTHNGDPQTITITVTPPVPGINSALSATGTFGAMFSYAMTATNTPTSYNATGLPAGLVVDTVTGAITGTPTVTGSFSVTLSATNAGGTGQATLMLTINPAAQVIVFGAQTSPRPWSQGGSFAISPVATGGASGNSIVYGSGTPTTCTVSTTTVSILRAGICTISADQAGNANYAAATQVTRDVNITAIPPTAPTIGTATPGNGSATVSFTAPSSDGGAAIETYTVTCGTQSATGPASPITVSGLVNGVTVACKVTANNALAPISPDSGTVMVTPIAIQFANNVFSRKVQNAGNRDLPISHTKPANAPDIEPRAGSSAHTIHFEFTSAVTDPGSLVVMDLSTSTQIMGPTAAANGNDVVVTLTGVPSIARISIALTGVNGAVNASANLGLLPGDVNATGRVTAADVAAVKAKSGNTPVDGTNYKLDINVNGSISSTDVNAVKATAGQVLP